MTRLALAFAATLATTASLGLAQSEGQAIEFPRGLWATEPDAAGIVYHVRTRACGRALCGRIERVKDRRGYDRPSNAVSTLVLDHLRPRPDGSFEGALNDRISGEGVVVRLEVVGNRLLLNTCQESDCVSEEWSRLR